MGLIIILLSVPFVIKRELVQGKIWCIFLKMDQTADWCFSIYSFIYSVIYVVRGAGFISSQRNVAILGGDGWCLKHPMCGLFCWLFYFQFYIHIYAKCTRNESICQQYTDKTYQRTPLHPQPLKNIRQATMACLIFWLPYFQKGVVPFSEAICDIFFFQGDATIHFKRPPVSQ